MSAASISFILLPPQIFCRGLHSLSNETISGNCSEGFDDDDETAAVDQIFEQPSSRQLVIR
jgi:hypothetical protein